MHFFLQYFTEFWKLENIYMQTNQIVRGVDKTTCHRILIFVSPITNRHLFGGNILCWSFNMFYTHGSEYQNNIYYSRYTEDLISIHKFSQNCTHYMTQVCIHGRWTWKINVFYLTIMHRQGNLCIHSHSSQPSSPVWKRALQRCSWQLRMRTWWTMTRLFWRVRRARPGTLIGVSGTYI